MRTFKNYFCRNFQMHHTVLLSRARSLVYIEICCLGFICFPWCLVAAESYFQIVWTQPLSFYGRKQFRIGRKLNWMPCRSFPHMIFCCTKQIHIHSNDFPFILFKLPSRKDWIQVSSHKLHSFNSVNLHKPLTPNFLQLVEKNTAVDVSHYLFIDFQIINYLAFCKV